MAIKLHVLAGDRQTVLDHFAALDHYLLHNLNGSLNHNFLINVIVSVII